MAINKHWIKCNYNPWHQNIGDCVIRAVSAGTGLDYREVCKRLHVSYKNGHGLIRDTGINLEDVEEVFGEYFDIIENFYNNNDFVPDEFKDTWINHDMEQFEIANGINEPTGLTLNEFVDLYKDQGTFLVSLIRNPEVKNIPMGIKDGHIVCVKCKGKNQGFIDTWNSGDLLVDEFMRVKKKEPTTSPLHWKYDYEQRKFIV